MDNVQKEHFVNLSKWIVYEHLADYRCLVVSISNQLQTSTAEVDDDTNAQKGSNDSNADTTSMSEHKSQI